MVADIDSMLEAGELWTYGHGVASVAAAGTVKIGITSGNKSVKVLARGYFSTGAPLRVNLYEVAWSGGAALNTTYNRNQEYIGGAQPVAMLQGVTFTPNTPIVALTINAASGAGNAQLSVSDDQPIQLKKSTQYVLELVNAAAGNADMGFTATLRRKQASETLRSTDPQ